ncbi:MAG: hypothetical protein ACTIH0_03495, partial [Psychrobacter celer]
MKTTTLSTSVPPKAPALATLTAVAAACAMMLSAPAHAAEAQAASSATDATNAASVPSAIDSSKRVIRLAQPKADNAASTKNAPVPQAAAPQPPTVQNRPPMSTLQP